MQGAAFFAGVVLALTDKLATWWGIAIMVVAFLLAASYATADANPEHRSNRVEVFTLLIPTVIAFYVGNALWHPWGAIIGAVALNPIGTATGRGCRVPAIIAWLDDKDRLTQSDGETAGAHVGPSGRLSAGDDRGRPPRQDRSIVGRH